METIVAFLQGLLNFALAFVKLVISFFIYIFQFVISLLQQLLGAVV